MVGGWGGKMRISETANISFLLSSMGRGHWMWRNTFLGNSIMGKRANTVSNTENFLGPEWEKKCCTFSATIEIMFWCSEYEFQYLPCEFNALVYHILCGIFRQ